MMGCSDTNSGYNAADFPAQEKYLNNAQDVPPEELLTDICLLLSSEDENA